MKVGFVPLSRVLVVIVVMVSGPGFLPARDIERFWSIPCYSYP